jgi:hypothetical protein
MTCGVAQRGMLLALAMVAAAAAVPQNQMRKSMAPEIEQASRQLAEYEKTHRLTDLESAIDAITAVDLLRTPSINRAEARKEVTRLWLAALQDLDALLDPKFDPEDRPVTKVAPPKVNGVQYPPGVDPKVITDPQARAEYEAAIKANLEKIDRGKQQIQLRNMDEEASESLDRYLKRYYTLAAADTRELAQLLDAAKISRPRRLRIESSVRAK